MTDDPILAQLQAERSALQERVSAIDTAIAALSGGAVPALTATMLKFRGAAVGADKMDRVREYMRRHGEARQADIARDLQLNTGTISVAMRMLEESGEAKSLGKRNRSQYWRWTG